MSLWVHLKLYIHLIFYFSIQPHQLQYFIVYICFLNSPCSFKMISKLYWKLYCNIVLEKKLGLQRRIFIADLDQMQQEKFVVSNAQFFTFHRVQSSMSSPFPSPISSVFIYILTIYLNSCYLFM